MEVCSLRGEVVGLSSVLVIVLIIVSIRNFSLRMFWQKNRLSVSSQLFWCTISISFRFIDFVTVADVVPKKFVSSLLPGCHH